MEQQIIKQTIEVRKLQKEYFRTRDKDVLRMSKNAEILLDKLLCIWLNEKPEKVQNEINYPTLF